MLSVFPEPPTEATLNDARRELISQRDSLTALTDKIDGAELALAQIVAESKCTISEMQRERLALEEQLTHTLAYTAPIRRLPQELLRHIFMFNFDDYSCCAWVLAAVCSLWRRLALSMPKIWSKVRPMYYVVSDGSDVFCVSDSPSYYPKFFRRHYPFVARALRGYSVAGYLDFSPC